MSNKIINIPITVLLLQPDKKERFMQSFHEPTYQEAKAIAKKTCIDGYRSTLPSWKAELTSVKCVVFFTWHGNGSVKDDCGLLSENEFELNFISLNRQILQISGSTADSQSISTLMAYTTHHVTKQGLSFILKLPFKGIKPTFTFLTSDLW
jgi:hypothetical protein